MTNFQQNLLNHLKSINKFLADYSLEASLRLPDMSLCVPAGGRGLCLAPSFLQGGRDRKMQLVSDGKGTGGGFAGWLPRRGVRWPEMSSKLAFKRRAAMCGLRVPASFVATGDHGEVLVKPDRSAYVEGLRGPYADASSAGAAGRLGCGEYYERFVVGSNLRVWCWRDQAVCAELETSAVVTGDGGSSIRGLVQKARRNNGYRVYVEDISECMAARAGFSLEDVLPAGVQLAVDFRYGSVLQPRVATDGNILPQAGAALVEQIRSAAKVASEWIPTDARMETVFALDAVVDADGLVWWLNMEADPAVHPAAYPAMLTDLLGLHGAPGGVEAIDTVGSSGDGRLSFVLQMC